MARFGFGVPLVLLVAPLVAPQSDPRAASFTSQAIAARIDWRVSAMKRLMLSLIVGFAVATFSQLAIAQSDTGFQPFGTFQSASGPETVNLANLDVHLDIPIVSKTGVGLPFTYSLRFDSLAWTRAWSGGNNQFW